MHPHRRSKQKETDSKVPWTKVRLFGFGYHSSLNQNPTKSIQTDMDGGNYCKWVASLTTIRFHSIPLEKAHQPSPSSTRHFSKVCVVCQTWHCAWPWVTNPWPFHRFHDAAILCAKHCPLPRSGWVGVESKILLPLQAVACSQNGPGISLHSATCYSC